MKNDKPIPLVRNLWEAPVFADDIRNCVYHELDGGPMVDESASALNEAGWLKFVTKLDGPDFGIWSDKSRRELITHVHGTWRLRSFPNTDSWNRVIDELCAAHPEAIVATAGNRIYQQDRSWFYLATKDENNVGK